MVRYKESEIILDVHSDASFLVDLKAHIRYRGHLFMKSESKQVQPMMNNGAVHVTDTIIPHVIS